MPEYAWIYDNRQRPEYVSFNKNLEKYKSEIWKINLSENSEYLSGFNYVRVLNITGLLICQGS